MVDTSQPKPGSGEVGGPRGDRRLTVALTLTAVAVVVVVAGFLLARSRSVDGPGQPADGPASPVVADCSTDVTDEVTKIIAAAEPGTTVRLQPDGCYRIDGTISLQDVVGVTIDGNGATLDASHEAGARSRRHIRIRGGGDLVIENLSIIGSRCAEPPCSEGGLAEMERQHGIAIENVDGITIQRVHITNVWGDFVYMTQKGEGSQPSEVVIRDNLFKNSGRQGIAGSGVVGLMIDSNWIFDAGRSVFDFEAEGGGARDVTITNNVIVRPDNATLNVGCADRGTGKPLNVGPIRLLGNRIYEAPLRVDTACGGQPDLSAQLDVVIEANVDDLEGQPPRFPGS